MKPLQLLSIGVVNDGMLQFLESALRQQLQVPCEIVQSILDPASTYHAERRQYHSSEVLSRMQSFAGAHCWRMLGVADIDLYIPILTFVFGEAQIGGPCAVVSTRRLKQEFYGFPADEGLLRQRLLKEAIHEIGHTCDLTHCENYNCAMASSHAVEWIDLKQAAFCSACQQRIVVCTQ